MTISMEPAVAGVHPLLSQLVDRHGFADVSVDAFDGFVSRTGHTVLFFAEDPTRYKETLDLAVILPEIVRTFPGRFAVGVLMPEVARAIAVRYGFRRWPALVMLKDGGYVGAIDGLRNWDEYLNETARLLSAPVTRPPSIGIAVSGRGGESSCAH